MDNIWHVKPEPEESTALSGLQDQHPRVLSTTEIWPEHQDPLGTRLIKNEERLMDLIGSCEVEEPKLEKFSEDELEMEMQPEKPSDEMPLTICKKEVELDEELEDQHTTVHLSQDPLMTKLIKKEEHSHDMELIGTCDAEEPKVEQISADEHEMELNPEKDLKGEAMLTTELKSRDLCEPNKKEKVTRRKRKHANPERLKKILNYKLKIEETELDLNKCYICKADFADMNDMEVHLHVHSDMIPYDCEECKISCPRTNTIYTVIMLNRHFRMHAGSIKCPECAFRTCTRNGLYKHIKRWHMVKTNEVYTCEVCGAEYKNLGVFQKHTAIHKAIEEGQHTCKYCGEKFATNTQLKHHERTHTSENVYQCRFCIRSFTDETNFHVHERYHSGERGFRCDDCDKNFRTRVSLTKHLAVVHKIESESLHPSSSGTTDKCGTSIKCTHENCDFETTIRSKYYKHREKHALNHPCPECDQRFRTRQQLVVHTYVHTGTTPYSCDICKKSFPSRNSYFEHMAVHNNIRPYSCTVCEKSFARNRCLTRHMAMHSDEMNFMCHCGRKFRHSSSLYTHEKSHAAKK